MCSSDLPGPGDSRGPGGASGTGGSGRDRPESAGDRAAAAWSTHPCEEQGSAARVGWARVGRPTDRAGAV